MPKLLEKHKVLGGRAEIIKYEESPNTWYYREKLPKEKAYRTRKISNVETKLEAEDAAILVYAKLRSDPVIRREDRLKRDVRAMIDDANNRFNDKISGLEGYVKRELDTLEDRLNEKLTKALENPLAN